MQSDEDHLRDKTAKCGLTIITKLIILEMFFRTIQSETTSGNKRKQTEIKVILFHEKHNFGEFSREYPQWLLFHRF